MGTQRNIVRWSVATAVALLAFSNGELLAQSPNIVPARPKGDFTIKRIDVRNVQLGASGSDEGRSKSQGQIPWTMLECEFDSQPEWADDVQLKWFVVLKGTKEKIMATGSDTYIYVKKGRRHVAKMFIHPFILERWTGGSGTTAIEDVGLEILWQGRRICSGDTKQRKEPAWWTSFSPQSGLIMRVNESPWATSLWGELEWSKFTTGKPSE